MNTFLLVLRTRYYATAAPVEQAYPVTTHATSLSAIRIGNNGECDIEVNDILIFVCVLHLLFGIKEGRWKKMLLEMILSQQIRIICGYRLSI